MEDTAACLGDVFSVGREIPGPKLVEAPAAGEHAVASMVAQSSSPKKIRPNEAASYFGIFDGTSFPQYLLKSVTRSSR